MTHNVAETAALGKGLAKRLKPGMVVALDGALGAGKTVFARGIARGMGISEPVLSPTFTLLRQYKGLNHFDAYRITDTAELDEIGFDELINGSAVSVIEWAERVADRLPDDAVHVTIAYGDTTNMRKVTIEYKGDA